MASSTSATHFGPNAPQSSIDWAPASTGSVATWTTADRSDTATILVVRPPRSTSRSMEMDSVDRMIEAWAESDPHVEARPLEVVGRLLLCARHLQHDLVAALRPFDLSFGDFDVINTLRRRADEDGTNPRELARVHLTERGERLAEQALEAVIAADEAFLEPLSQRQRDTLASALKQLLLHSEQR